jgi:hypothetical protein
MKLTKGIITVIFLASINCSAQIAVTTRTGVAYSDRFNAFEAIEIQASNVSLNLQFRPEKIDKSVYTGGFGLIGSFFLYPYQSTPYITTGIITHGKSELSQVTGKAKRSFIVAPGYRFYPSDRYRFIDDHLSFDIGVGIQLFESGIKFYSEISINIILFKFAR